MDEIKLYESSDVIADMVIGLDIKKSSYLEAIKNCEIAPLDSVLAHRNKFKSWYDEKGEIRAQLLKNITYLIDGKNAANIYELGAYLNYMNAKKKYRELGYKSIWEMFDDPAFPVTKSRGNNAMRLNERFDRETVIMLGHKTAYLLTIVDEINNKELAKIVKVLETLSDRDAKEFLKHYKAFLAGEKVLEKENVSVKRLPETERPISIDFQMPKFQVKGKKNLELKFEEAWEQQVFTLALRNLQPAIQREIMSIINSDGYKSYRKQAIKKYKSGE